MATRPCAPPFCWRQYGDTRPCATILSAVPRWRRRVKMARRHLVDGTKMAVCWTFVLLAAAVRDGPGLLLAHWRMRHHHRYLAAPHSLTCTRCLIVHALHVSLHPLFTPPPTSPYPVCPYSSVYPNPLCTFSSSIPPCGPTSSGTMRPTKTHCVLHASCLYVVSCVVRQGLAAESLDNSQPHMHTCSILVCAFRSCGTVRSPCLWFYSNIL